MVREDCESAIGMAQFDHVSSFAHSVSNKRRLIHLAFSSGQHAAVLRSARSLASNLPAMY